MSVGFSSTLMSITLIAGGSAVLSSTLSADRIKRMGHSKNRTIGVRSFNEELARAFDFARPSSRPGGNEQGILYLNGVFCVNLWHKSQPMLAVVRLLILISSICPGKSPSRFRECNYY